LRELGFEVRRGFSAGSIAAVLGGAVILFYGFSVMRGSSSSSGQIVVPLVGLVIIIGALYYALHTQTRFILAIEMAGGSISGLAAKDRKTLLDLKADIRDVIEYPPQQPTSIDVGDVYAVDIPAGVENSGTMPPAPRSRLRNASSVYDRSGRLRTRDP
jgi:hypothetical protein